MSVMQSSQGISRTNKSTRMAQAEEGVGIQLTANADQVLTTCCVHGQIKWCTMEINRQLGWGNRFCDTIIARLRATM